jgi:hypothetical protein
MADSLSEENTIRPLSPIGAVTANLLQFNAGDRLFERQLLIAIGRYPSPAVLRRMPM